MVKPDVTVISLTYNRRENLRELLSALRCQTYESFEVIVVDNASSDGTVEMVKRQYPEVRLIQAPDNLRNYSYNLGVEAARGEYLLLMDDDGQPSSRSWISQVVARFRADRELGVVACTVRMRDTGRIAHDNPQFVPQPDEFGGYPCPAYNGTGAGLRRRAVQAVGPMYPAPFFHIYIELHLCTRLMEAGWKVRYFPKIEVFHSRSSSDPPANLGYYGLRNYYWYVWTLYPRSMAWRETAHQIGYNLRCLFKRQVRLGLLGRALWDATRDVSEARKCRQAVSRETVDYLRWLRRHGNSHGVAPERVLFKESQ